MTTVRTIRDVLSDLSEAERLVLQEVLDLERERIALTIDHDMPDQIVKSLGQHIQ
jgi:hypothetical protein